MFFSIGISTSRRTEFIDITEKIDAVIKKSQVLEGICHVLVPHTTAGLTINENADPSVTKDILNTLNNLIPEGGKYTHSEGNSDAHIKSSVIGNEKSIVIYGGHLKLGTWQGIFFCEFDGPRKREVWIKIQGDKNAG